MTTQSGAEGAKGANGVWIGAGAFVAVVLAAIGWMVGSAGDEQATVTPSDAAPVTSEPSAPAATTTTTSQAPTTPSAPSAQVSTDQPVAPETVAPSFDVVRVDPDGRAVIAGHAAPGSSVQLLLDGAPVEVVKADGQGNFVSLLDLDISTPGQLALQALDGDGTPVASAVSQGTVLIQPTTVEQPAAQTGHAPATATDGSAGTDTAAMSAADTGDAPSTASADMPTPSASDAAPASRVLLADQAGITVLQDEAGALSVQNVIIDAISYDETGEVALSGRGQSGADVRIYLDNNPVKTSAISEDGQWRLPLPDIETGVYTLRVDELGPDGSVTSRTETPFKREEPAALQAVAEAAPKARVSAVTVQPGSSLWAIARDTLGEGVLYVRLFDANRDKIRDPDLIYPGQVFAIPSPNAAGN